MRPEKETPQPGRAWGAGQCTNDAENHGTPASKLIAEADAIAALIPYMMTRERKHADGSRVFKLWLLVLAVKRCNHDART